MNLKNKKNLLLIFSSFVILLLFIASIYLLFTNASLSKELSSTKSALVQKEVENTNLNRSLRASMELAESKSAQLKATQEELAQIGKELEESQAKLENTREQLQNVSGELNQTAASLEQTKKTSAELKTELTDMTSSLSDRINWLKNNANMPSPSYFSDSIRGLQYSAFLNDAKHKCIVDGVVKLPCISYLMARNIPYAYLSESDDKLSSLVESIQGGGGDCEDYSLFFKALINDYKSEFKNQELSLETVTPSSSGGSYTFMTTVDGDGYWYYPNSKPQSIGVLGNANPYVICYTTTYTSNLFEGHCIVTISNANVTNISDLPLLDSSLLFEPQNGFYKGKIGQDLHLCSNGEMYCETGINSAWLVMSDDDLYMFQDGKWKSFGTYNKVAMSLKEKYLS